jgi:hypothetical protein
LPSRKRLFPGASEVSVNFSVAGIISSISS